MNLEKICSFKSWEYVDCKKIGWASLKGHHLSSQIIVSINASRIVTLSPSLWWEFLLQHSAEKFEIL